MNVVNLKEKKDNSLDIEIVNIPFFQTKDGKTFSCKHEAEKHQKLLNKAEELAYSNLGQVYGITSRGHGTEFVDATYSTMLRYTINVLEHLKKENKLYL